MRQAILTHCDHKDGIEYFIERVKDCAIRLKNQPEAIFCEVGNYRGGSALAMLEVIKETNPDRWLFTVDPYGARPFVCGDELIDSDYNEDIYRDAKKLLSDYAYENKLNHYHWRLESDDFMKVLPDIYFWHNKSVIDPIFGCVYIDGEHTPDQVKREIEFFYNRMPSGGLIILDDSPYVESEFTKKKLTNSFVDNFRTYYVKS